MSKVDELGLCWIHFEPGFVHPLLNVKQAGLQFGDGISFSIGVACFECLPDTVVISKAI